jgi:hypothetical protein
VKKPYASNIGGKPVNNKNNNNFILNY